MTTSKGGRKKGGTNHVTEQQRRTILQEIKAKKKTTPIEFLLKVMWNKKRPMAIRIDAAKSVAPYIHKKMPLELQHSGEIEVIKPYIPSRSELKSRDPDFNGENG